MGPGKIHKDKSTMYYVILYYAIYYVILHYTILRDDPELFRGTSKTLRPVWERKQSPKIGR